jgi:hypothetical protein
VDVAFAVTVAVAARLVTLLIVWVHERHRSARAMEMARRLPPGSRYVEGATHVMIEIGSMDSGS